MELILLLLLIITICSLIRIEHFANQSPSLLNQMKTLVDEDTNMSADLDEKHQEIIDKIKNFNAETTQFETEINRLNTTDIPNLRKELNINEPQLLPCKSQYMARIEVIKKDELQKILNDTTNCSQEKIKYIKQKSEYESKLGKITFDKMQITNQIESLRATYKSILEEYEKKQKELDTLKSTYNGLQQNLSSQRSKFNSCVASRAAMPIR
jgi:chromosome segregation ATPase